MKDEIGITYLKKNNECSEMDLLHILFFSMSDKYSMLILMVLSSFVHLAIIRLRINK